MTVEIAGIAAFIMAIVAIATFHQKQRVDRVDLLSKVEKMHADCVDRQDRSEVKIDALEAEVRTLKGERIDDAAEITDLREYITRLLTWLKQRGIDYPEPPPATRRKR
jgi:hypothetical protein